MENLDFGCGHGRNFDHLTMVILKFWPWSWSKIFDHMTMTPGRRPNGQKIMVALPPPPPLNLITFWIILYDKRIIKAVSVCIPLCLDPLLFRIRSEDLNTEG